MVESPESVLTDPLAYARAALRRSRLRAETVLSVLRIVFCVLVVGRFVALNVGHHVPDTFERALLVLPATLAAIGFSAWTLHQISRRDRVSRTPLVMSVLFDTVVCTLALASNVLWPWPTYNGLLMLPDPIALLVLVMTAGFRISFGLAVLGAVANFAGFCALTLADMQLNPESVTYDVGQISLYFIFMLGVAAISVVGARRTQTLVVEAARHASKTNIARRGLTEVLQEHHDALGLLSAALFGVDKLKEDRVDAAVLSELKVDLELLRDAVLGIREQALAEVTTLDDAAHVDASALLKRHRETFERGCAPLRVAWQLPSAPALVEVTGGDKALLRVLLNLLKNAREGDGSRGAKHCHVELRLEEPTVTLIVEDDGPGLSSSESSTKAGGTGSGLRFVQQVARASRGTFELSNGEAGARATLVLPRATGVGRHTPEFESSE